MFLVNLFLFQPKRHYSISSSQSLHPEEVHTTVAVVTYQTNAGHTHHGVCSYFMSNLNQGETIHCNIRTYYSLSILNSINVSLINDKCVFIYLMFTTNFYEFFCFSYLSPIIKLVDWVTLQLLFMTVISSVFYRIIQSQLISFTGRQISPGYTGRTRHRNRSFPFLLATSGIRRPK